MTEQVDLLQRIRGHRFTINNPTEEDREQVLSLQKEKHFKYLIFQLEEGENKTPHFQGYVNWSEKKTLLSTTRLLKRGHILPGHASPKSNRDYATKLIGRLDGPWEFGDCPAPGKRSDLEDAAETLKSTGSLKRVAEEHPTAFIKFYRGLEVYKNTIVPTKPRDFLTELYVFYGDPGTGKSWTAHEISKSDIYPLSFGNSGIWWDGYEGQSFVLIDEFKSNLPLGTLKRLADRYPVKVDRKGLTSVEFTSRTLVITTNIDPSDWYAGDKVSDTEREALKRRITFLVRFSRGSFPVIEYDVRENKTDLPICPFV